MWRCSVCSFTNEDTVEQCGRCQTKANPNQRNPWGLRKGRSTSYWSNYDWDAGNQIVNGEPFPSEDNDRPRTITEERQHHNTNIHDRYMDKNRGIRSRDALQRKNNRENKVLQPFPYYPGPNTENLLVITPPDDDDSPPLTPDEEGDGTAPPLAQPTPRPSPSPPTEDEDRGEIPAPIPDPELIRTYGLDYSRISLTIIDEISKVGACGILTSYGGYPPNKDNGYSTTFALQDRRVRPGEVWSLRNSKWRASRGIPLRHTAVLRQKSGECFAYADTDLMSYHTGRHLSPAYGALLDYHMQGVLDEIPMDEKLSEERRKELEGSTDSQVLLAQLAGKGFVDMKDFDHGEFLPLEKKTRREYIEALNNAEDNHASPAVVQKHHTMLGYKSGVPVWRHRYKTKEAGWDLICSSIWAGAPVSVSFCHNKGLEFYNCEQHHQYIDTLGGPSSKGRYFGHAITVWGVKIGDNHDRNKESSKYGKIRNQNDRFVLIKNSWGKDGWGVKGWAWVHWDSFYDNCELNDFLGIAHHPANWEPLPLEPEQEPKVIEDPTPYPLAVVNNGQIQQIQQQLPPQTSFVGYYKHPETGVIYRFVIHYDVIDGENVITGAEYWSTIPDPSNAPPNYENPYLLGGGYDSMPKLIEFKRRPYDPNDPGSDFPLANPTRKSNIEDTSSPEMMQTVSPVVWSPASEPITKMVVFDIDDTLLDTSQRMRSAIRMGLFDPKARGKKSHPKGIPAFRDFYYSTERFNLDTVIPGALDLVQRLQQEGYTIAYCTGRPRRIFEATKNQLRSHGFPIMRDKNGYELLAMKPDNNDKTTSYKFNALRDLQHRYDVRMFFDNHPGNLAEAQKLGIPGLYLSVDQYTGIQDLAKRFNKDKRKVMDDIKRNPVAFPIPESYKQRLAKQLGEEMTSEGYRPLEVQKDFIDTGAYHGNKSDFSYVQGEYQEFLDEIELQDWDEAYAEYSDVESHLAYYMYTNYGISIPVYTHDHIRKVLFRVKLFESVMKHFKLKFHAKYLVNGSNYKKVAKVRKALELAAKDQKKKLPEISDAKLMSIVELNIDKVKANPPETFTKTKVNDSVKGTKIKKKPDPESGNNCNSCAYYKPIGTTDDATREVGLCSLWSDKMNREVLVGDTFYCQGWKPDSLNNPSLLEETLARLKEEDDERRMGKRGGTTASASNFRWRGNPGHADYRVAAGCIVQKPSDKKILLLRRSPKETSMHGLYELPGGKLEEGETPRDTAIVETKEEAGMDVNIVREITPPHVDHQAKKRYHAFMATPKTGSKVVLSEEHDKYIWITMEDALLMEEPLSHHAEYFFRMILGVKDNPSGVLPIMTGEPTGKFTNLGSVFSEVFIGRNIVKDVGEVVQGVYRGLVGGRTSMAEKRMAMAIASMQKELSDQAVALGGNAIANLRIDYELQGAGTVTLMAHADAIKMPRPPKNNPRYDLPSKTKGRNDVFSQEQLVGMAPNPLPKPKKNMKPKKYIDFLMGNTKMRTEYPDRRQRYAVALSLVKQHYGNRRVGLFEDAQKNALRRTANKKQLKRAGGKKAGGLKSILNNPGDPIELYESFNGQPPDQIKTINIEIPSTLVRIGEGGCWSVGYRSDKEGHGEDQKYIHNFGDFGRFPKKKPKPGDRKEPDLYAAMDESGNVSYLVIMGGTFSLDTDPDSGINWLVG